MKESELLQCAGVQVIFI